MPTALATAPRPPLALLTSETLRAAGELLEHLVRRSSGDMDVWGVVAWQICRHGARASEDVKDIEASASRLGWSNEVLGAVATEITRPAAEVAA